MSPGRVTMEWAEIPAEELPGKTATQQPICWDCHVVESLYFPRASLRSALGSVLPARWAG